MIPLLLAAALGRPVALVDAVYQEAAGLDRRIVVALVEWESKFDPTDETFNPDGSSDWGLFKLCSRYHHQYRDNIDKHISYAVAFLRECVAKEGGSMKRGLARYNSGNADLASGKEFSARVSGVRMRMLIRAGRGIA